MSPTLRRAIDEMHAARVARLSPRVTSGKCCEHVAPAGTFNSRRFCKSAAAGMHDGLTYCARHLDAMQRMAARDAEAA